MTLRHGFTARVVGVIVVVLTVYAVFVALVFRHEAQEREAVALQGVSADLARHIVDHWPQITGRDPDAAERAAREAVLQMLMSVNPGVQVYLLDADGRVAEYLGEPGMVRTPSVDLDPIRRFLAGGALPLRGTDPMGTGASRLFSAAMFPPVPGVDRPPGYLYVVLDGAARREAAGAAGPGLVWRSAGAVVALGLVLAACIGALAVMRLARPLRALAQRMEAYGAPAADVASTHALRDERDEIATLDRAFTRMTRRLEQQSAREHAQAAAHRETIAGVAHDLRTPLTALHGQLEALQQGPGPVSSGVRTPDQAALVAAALRQSAQVHRLSTQLFELAALESAPEVTHRERFRLDELVADAVAKFRGGAGAAEVRLGGVSPGPLEVDGDLHLIERALTNLIDNARRHGGAHGPVTVRLSADAGIAHIVVEDDGPGLPTDIGDRLRSGASLRDPPLRRPRGGIGGLGLAIAQRVAALHGGTLQPLPTPTHGGSQLCLALPLAS
ncbi:MAG: sensor histidine kinase [Burkholderiales bacterium]|jgi:signal transduction histidine kinase|nr:sensor histidine kinase [Burkholderiales bacterium]